MRLVSIILRVLFGVLAVLALLVVVLANQSAVEAYQRGSAADALALVVVFAEGLFWLGALAVLLLALYVGTSPWVRPREPDDL